MECMWSLAIDIWATLSICRPHVMQVPLKTHQNHFSESYTHVIHTGAHENAYMAPCRTRYDNWYATNQWDPYYYLYSSVWTYVWRIVFCRFPQHWLMAFLAVSTTYAMRNYDFLTIKVFSAVVWYKVLHLYNFFHGFFIFQRFFCVILFLAEPRSERKYNINP